MENVTVPSLNLSSPFIELAERNVAATTATAMVLATIFVRSFLFFSFKGIIISNKNI